MNRVLYDSINRITKDYGVNGHKGVDLGWNNKYTFEQNYNVYSNCKGTVVEVVDGLDNLIGSTGITSWGNFVTVKHSNGMYSRYAHLRKGIPVKVGQEVDENTVLGLMGDSGNAIGNHLHFDVQTSLNANTRINPTPYLTKAISDDTAPVVTGIVSIIQSTLNSRYNTGLVVDNIYGNLTHRAMVKALQTELNKQYGRNLVIDGIFGNATRNACPNNITVGAKGNITWLIQAMLIIKGYNLTLDGVFGADTKTKLMSYQSDNGLVVDGICGINTFTKLFS